MEVLVDQEPPGDPHSFGRLDAGGTISLGPLSGPLERSFAVVPDCLHLVGMVVVGRERAVAVGVGKVERLGNGFRAIPAAL